MGKSPSQSQKPIALKLQEIDLIIPLAPYKKIKNSNIYQDIVKDGAIFTIYEKNDARRNMVSMDRYIEILFQTLKNELVNVCNRVPALRKELDALKHVANPLPWAVKRTILLDSLLPFIKNLVFHSVAKPEISRVTGGLEPICSNKSHTNIKCANQCSKIMTRRSPPQNLTGHCRLAIPKEYQEYLVERCIEYLLNPVNPNEITPIAMDQEIIDENIIVFSNADVIMQGMEAIIAQLTAVGSTTFEKEFKEVTQTTQQIDAVPLPAFFKNLVDHDKPSFMVSSQLKSFALKKVEGMMPSEWLYELFTAINRRISAKAAALSEENIKALVAKKIKSSWRADPEATLARLADNPCFNRLISEASSVPTESAVMSTIANPQYQISAYELEILAQLLGINVFITTRQTQRTPDRMRCLGKQPRIDYYVMLHQQQPSRTSKDGIDQFYLYLKAGNKYLFTLADLGAAFGKCVKAKCTKGFSQEDLDGVCPPYK